MLPTIFLLSEEAINQIAAGEVILSPASAIKELIENSLDAGAKKITVEIVGGGLQLIKVTDDGKGMHQEDALLSIKRHTTSKLVKADDLFSLTTKGFRGEALASIASVSTMTLTTAQEDRVGTKLEIEKGQVLHCSKCARIAGTTVEVYSLFANVPARKKFQKTPTALSAEIFRIVSILALSHPEISFELKTNGRSVLKTFAHLNPNFKESLKQRAKEILGNDFVINSLSLSLESQGFKIEGLIGSPLQTRTNKLGQYLFINQRAVSCPLIAESVRKGFGTRLEEKRHPLFLLHLNVPAYLVDVNVHPQKLEVRLLEEELFETLIFTAVSEALSPKRSPASHLENGVFSPPFQEKSSRFDQFHFVIEAHQKKEEPSLPFEEEFLEVIGLFRHYLFLEGRSLPQPIREEDSLVALDLHEVHLHLLLEELSLKQEKHLPSQGLLIPLKASFTPIEMSMILTHQHLIEELGFSLYMEKEDTFHIRALPPFIEEEKIQNTIAQMANDLQFFIGKLDDGKERKKKLLHSLIRFAKTKHYHNIEEAKHLAERFFKTDVPLFSPKGNPIFLYLNEDALQNLFRQNKALRADP